MSEKLRFAHTDEQRWAALRAELHEQGKVNRQQLIELVGIRNELKAQNERMDRGEQRFAKIKQQQTEHEKRLDKHNELNNKGKGMAYLGHFHWGILAALLEILGYELKK